MPIVFVVNQLKKLINKKGDRTHYLKLKKNIQEKDRYAKMYANLVHRTMLPGGR